MVLVREGLELDADDRKTFWHMYLILSVVKYDSDDKDGKYTF